MTDFAVEEFLITPDFESGQIGDWTNNASTTLAIVNIGGQAFTKALQGTGDGTNTIQWYQNTQIACSGGQVIYFSAQIDNENLPSNAMNLQIYCYDANHAFFTTKTVKVVPSLQPWGLASGSISFPAGAAYARPGLNTNGTPAAGDYSMMGPASCSRYDPNRMTWLWLPSYNAKTTQKPRVLEANFGDGYSQRAADGINTNPESWDLKFTARNEADAVAMDDFLVARGGHESFQWIAPNNMNGAPNVPLSGNPKLYICKQHDITRMRGPFFEVTATFDEVFDL